MPRETGVQVSEDAQFLANSIKEIGYIVKLPGHLGVRHLVQGLSGSLRPAFSCL
jgi:hypothetical protein